MKYALFIPWMLLCSSVFAGEPSIYIQQSTVVKAELHGSDCRMTVDSSTEDGHVRISLADYCKPSTTSDRTAKLRGALFAKLAGTGIFVNASTIEIDFTPLPEGGKFMCDLIHLASASNDWPPLLKKLEIPPGAEELIYADSAPDGFLQEFGAFVLKSGLLRDFEVIFARQGYRLKEVVAAPYNLSSIKKLGKKDQTCLVPHPVADMMPSYVELELTFEKIEPPPESLLTQ